MMEDGMGSGLQDQEYVTGEASVHHPMFKAFSPIEAFSMVQVGQVPDANELRVGQVLRIKAGGVFFDFTVSSATDRTSEGEFFSLASLAEAINESTGHKIKATIGIDGRLHISAKDGDPQLSFSEHNPVAGRNLVEELGIHVEAPVELAGSMHHMDDISR